MADQTPYDPTEPVFGQDESVDVDGRPWTVHVTVQHGKVVAFSATVAAGVEPKLSDLDGLKLASIARRVVKAAEAAEEGR